jgi:hypothetical protein
MPTLFTRLTDLLRGKKPVPPPPTPSTGAVRRFAWIEKFRAS